MAELGPELKAGGAGGQDYWGTLAIWERDLGAADLGVSRSGQRLSSASCLPSVSDFILLRGRASHPHPPHSRPSDPAAGGLDLTVTFVCSRFVWSNSRRATPAVTTSNALLQKRGLGVLT